MDIWNILQRAVALYPAQVAVVDGARRLTYGQLGARAAALAGVLARRGVEPGQRVAVLDHNSGAMLEATFAVAGLGAILCPLNVRLSTRELAGILRDAGAQLLLVGEAFDEAARALEPELPRLELLRVSGQAYEDTLAADQAAPPSHRAAPDDVAQLYYTSGTTGQPKGVMLTQRNICLHALGTVAELQLSDQDVWAHVAPMFHLADAWASVAITWVGGRHVMLSRFDAAAALGLIERQRITISNLIPTMLNLMIKHPAAGDHDYSSLRLLLSGGAPMAPEVVRQVMQTFGCEYAQTYGMTETSPYLTLSLLKPHLRDLPAAQQLRYRSRTGRPFITVQLKVVDQGGDPVRPDDQQVGEIWVRGDTVTPGYWNLPQETARAFSDGWLRTGDLAVVDAEGYVNIVDRKKDMILCGGENVYSVEVEHVLYQHTAVLEAAVYGVPDQTWGEAVQAAVVLRPGRAVEAEELIAFCRQRLAHYKAPGTVVFLAQLPRTGSGKIHKQALRDRHTG